MSSGSGLRSRIKARNVDLGPETSAPGLDDRKTPARNVLHDSERLGFAHWLFMLVVVVAFYGTASWLDARMPEVVDSSQKTQFSEERARDTLKKLTDLGLVRCDDVTMI